MVAQENVNNFETSVIQEYLGRLYFIDLELINTLQFGHPNTRERKWTIFRHKTKTLAFRSPRSQLDRKVPQGLQLLVPGIPYCQQ